MMMFMSQKNAYFAAVFASALLSASIGRACTNYLVSKGASEDGSTMISYSADSGSLYGTLKSFPALSNVPAGTKVQINDWDSGVYLGEIPQAENTYSVVGNANEHGLAIAETTFGGTAPFNKGNDGAVLDYGSLIWLTLQRARNASEAITVMDSLTNKYGYASGGESFAISDPNEVWLLEMISKGEREIGSVWVARKVPEGFVCGTANQARIRTWPRDDPENNRWSKDVVDVARRAGLFNGTDEEFSFSDTYNPVSAAGPRVSEIRVWNFFRQVTEEAGFEDKYLNYVKGQDPTNRFPLFAKVKRKVSLNDTMWYMRSHFQDTYFDGSKDVGAGSSKSFFRRRPLMWQHDGRGYVNERTVAVQQSGWHFVAQGRPNYPSEMSILWFGLDDASLSPHTPIYYSASRASKHWQDGYGSATEWEDSAFWAYNSVANFVYPRYEYTHGVVQQKIIQIEKEYFEMVKNTDSVVLQMIQSGNKKGAVEKMTSFSENLCDKIVATWFSLWKQLMVTFRDGFIVSPQKPAHARDLPIAKVVEPGYDDDWYARIIHDTKDHYCVSNCNSAADANEVLPALPTGV